MMLSSVSLAKFRRLKKKFTYPPTAWAVATSGASTAWAKAWAMAGGAILRVLDSLKQGKA